MSKVKVSITIEKSVLERRAADGMSRSEIVERALKRLLSDQLRRHLEGEIAAYYEDQAEWERSEDRKWAGSAQVSSDRAGDAARSFGASVIKCC